MGSPNLHKSFNFHLKSGLFSCETPSFELWFIHIKSNFLPIWHTKKTKRKIAALSNQIKSHKRQSMSNALLKAVIWATQTQASEKSRHWKRSQNNAVKCDPSKTQSQRRDPHGKSFCDVGQTAQTVITEALNCRKLLLMSWTGPRSYQD